MGLEKQHQEFTIEFHKGNFVHKFDKDFFLKAIDQAHEQNNTVIKEDKRA